MLLVALNMILCTCINANNNNSKQYNYKTSGCWNFCLKCKKYIDHMLSYIIKFYTYQSGKKRATPFIYHSICKFHDEFKGITQILIYWNLIAFHQWRLFLRASAFFLKYWYRRICLRLLWLNRALRNSPLFSIPPDVAWAIGCPWGSPRFGWSLKIS